MQVLINFLSYSANSSRKRTQTAIGLYYHCIQKNCKQLIYCCI